MAAAIPMRPVPRRTKLEGSGVTCGGGTGGGGTGPELNVHTPGLLLLIPYAPLLSCTASCPLLPFQKVSMNPGFPTLSGIIPSKFQSTILPAEFVVKRNPGFVWVVADRPPTAMSNELGTISPLVLGGSGELNVRVAVTKSLVVNGAVTAVKSFPV
jgi:hypothetical protein